MPLNLGASVFSSSKVRKNKAGKPTYKAKLEVGDDGNYRLIIPSRWSLEEINALGRLTSKGNPFFTVTVPQIDLCLTMATPDGEEKEKVVTCPSQTFRMGLAGVIDDSDESEE